ncbi:NAD(P)-binding protein [Annulohypoxylon truncatum]|uniref:NAD(P)-binding protein n=1 Tax=Annulohypoxylon truncatum TaxID=327061 RepID=UPI0020078DC0|nr:NAD(P)-binding protein [Annulohypoxylon truncatum]KAI1214875.1 NAD(P)-binding protein [Annulohypoxylon truncatum]
MSLSALWQQFFPPRPTFTDKDVKPGSQVGKVFIITGAHSGIGLALLKILYPTGATIYLAGRSPAKMDKAIREVAAASSNATTPATLKTLYLDITDLATVKPAASTFTSRETRLDVLWNNAGVGCPAESVTKQGLEVHVGANCVAPLLFVQELLPVLRATARSPDTPRASVRIVWSGSLHIEMTAPPGGIDFTRIDSPRPEDVSRLDYAASKAGNWFLAAEGARRWGADGIMSVCQNPGNLYTSFYDNEPWLLVLFLKTFILYETRYGAYTMLFAGLSPLVGEGGNGAYIWPWGRIKPVARPDVLREGAEEGGKAKAFWEWCERAWEKHI